MMLPEGRSITAPFPIVPLGGSWDRLVLRGGPGLLLGLRRTVPMWTGQCNVGITKGSEPALALHEAILRHGVVGKWESGKVARVRSSHKRFFVHVDSPSG